MRVLHTTSVDETRALGAALGRLALPGTVVALVGDLGAGKTAFAQGVGEGLGLAHGVQSPTFVLVDEHHGGRLPLVHADLYRLEEAGQLEQLGLEERLEAGDAVGLVEWADRFPHVLPADHLEVRLVHDGARRRLEIEATGPWHARLAERLGA
ncbi:MAG: tRNA (adenosine(37)-N6)-threonylcarbamoyltransferase complex ATPase subunit type 1 TsaE [Alphaproteobacteria bacterium]|nr:tRNA (adenosine(37)-N6)-threonylcarbamoyltransferase complex ATPase subunit type 1 TsaE [Alphaproteobacteria bacterium]